MLLDCSNAAPFRKISKDRVYEDENVCPWIQAPKKLEQLHIKVEPSESACEVMLKRIKKPLRLLKKPLTSVYQTVATTPKT